MTPTILIVDDEEAILESLADSLAMSHWQVITARNGAEGLQRLKETTPDLVICDLMMPVMDGIQLCRRVREEPAWVAIPFLLLAAPEDVEHIHEGYRQGADHCLTKPVDPEELHVVVESCLRRSQDIRGILRRQALRRTQPRGTLSTELREPLELIQHYLAVYQEEIKRLKPERSQQISALTVRTLERMVKLFEDLMLIVYIGSGAVQVEIQSLYQRLDLTALLVEVMDSHRGAATQKQVDLVHFLPKGLRIHGHRHFLMGAFERLLDNAIKFSQPGGTVWIEAQRLRENVVVTIRDQGMGISAEQLGNLFMHFDNPERVKIEKQGTGLGLAIAAGLVQGHGGLIQVESALGKGSTFSVLLPGNLGGTGPLEGPLPDEC